MAFKESYTSEELGKVFAAAVVNRKFRDLLLKNPSAALRNGYLGETFSLPKREYDLLITIRAGSLPDFARQVTRSLDVLG